MPSVGAQRAAERMHPIWTHHSVIAMSSGADPIDAIKARARSTVFRAIQQGWSGPPYDPFALADFLKISVEPRQDVIDARTVATGGGRFRIEFNPSRSPARIKFSIAHEIAHTLFPDCAESIRNRYTHQDVGPSDWQLEALCNIAAAEILMPTGSFKPPEAFPISIDAVLELRRQYSVSSEAVLLRIAKITNHQCLAFAAHREEGTKTPHYRIDYAARSRTWPTILPSGFRLPPASQVAQCTAIGFTAKFEEEWIPSRGRWMVECLGIPPYPGHVYPRIIGIVRPKIVQVAESAGIVYLRGDATQPRGTEKRILAQVVNDKALRWGEGFSGGIKKRWPGAHKEFTNWILRDRRAFCLGNIHITQLEGSLALASLVAQHGYGPSLFPRIQYSALEDCLHKLAIQAREAKATIHMPRIGSGQAGGDWSIIEEIIDEVLCRQDISVTVYDLPEAPFEGKRPSTPKLG